MCGYYFIVYMDVFGSFCVVYVGLFTLSCDGVTAYGLHFVHCIVYSIPSYWYTTTMVWYSGTIYIHLINVREAVMG